MFCFVLFYPIFPFHVNSVIYLLKKSKDGTLHFGETSLINENKTKAAFNNNIRIDGKKSYIFSQTVFNNYFNVCIYLVYNCHMNYKSLILPVFKPI